MKTMGLMKKRLSGHALHHDTIPDEQPLIKHRILYLPPFDFPFFHQMREGQNIALKEGRRIEASLYEVDVY